EPAAEPRRQLWLGPDGRAHRGGAGPHAKGGRHSETDRAVSGHAEPSRPGSAPAGSPRRKGGSGATPRSLLRHARGHGKSLFRSEKGRGEVPEGAVRVGEAAHQDG